ncbi:MAG TPA: hypothetical protein VFP55_01800 [Solirubrobacteraceae bacterium]|nr:hypothetical protein [Solirubrobacteraceae bacterium]
MSSESQPVSGFPGGFLAEHPLPPGIVGALSLSGYQLLVDIAGVGAGRLGPQAFLLVADEAAEPMTHVSLHQSRLRGEAEAAAFVQLAAQLGFLRLSGYRVGLERAGLRSKLNLVNPATGAIALSVPEKHPGRVFGAGRPGVDGLLIVARALPTAGPPPDLQSPELLRQMLLSLALQDETVGGAQAAELADRALDLVRGDRKLDPARALEAAKQG